MSAALVATMSFTACTADDQQDSAPASLPLPDDEVAESDEGVEPIGGAVMSVSPLTVRHGDELEVEIDCPTDSSAEARFQRRNTRSAVADVVERIGTTSGSSSATGSLTVPYWLEPGSNVVEGFCNWPIAAPAPAEFDVLPPEQGSWDDWRPVDGPQLVEPIPEGAFREFGSWEYVVSDGESLAVDATCRSGVNTDGARFVVWAHDVIGDETIVIEHPVGEVEVLGDRIVIRADISFDPAPFTARVADFIAISALCTATDGPFDSASEWPPENPEPRLEGEIATIRLALAEG